MSEVLPESAPTAEERLRALISTLGEGELVALAAAPPRTPVFFLVPDTPGTGLPAAELSHLSVLERGLNVTEPEQVIGTPPITTLTEADAKE